MPTCLLSYLQKQFTNKQLRFNARRKHDLGRITFSVKEAETAYVRMNKELNYKIQIEALSIDNVGSHRITKTLHLKGYALTNKF